jgi:hypothetical protein
VHLYTHTHTHTPTLGASLYTYTHTHTHTYTLGASLYTHTHTHTCTLSALLYTYSYSRCIYIHIHILLLSVHLYTHTHTHTSVCGIIPVCHANPITSVEPTRCIIMTHFLVFKAVHMSSDNARFEWIICAWNDMKVSWKLHIHTYIMTIYFMCAQAQYVY